MKNWKRFVALGIAVVMAVSTTACGGGKKEESKDEETEVSDIAFDKETEINIGVYQDMYYDSSHTAIEDNPNLNDKDTAQMQLDNVRAVEKRYNCKFYFKNLTWEGIIESINTSIMSGTPDCQLYDVQFSYGIPAIMAGSCQALEDFIPADDDVFTDQKYMKSLKVMNQDKSYLFASSGGVDTTATGLCFNMDIVCKERGLENPQDIYDRGEEWTWDLFQEYLAKCTFDRDGDGSIDVYGYGASWTLTLWQLLMSNGTGMAFADKQLLTTKEDIEVFTFIDNMYNKWKVAKPWDESDFMGNGRTWADGLVAFWPAQHWMLNESDIYSKEWELGVVPWPVGPSGNKETNATNQVAGDWMIIPVGVDNPYTIYSMYADYQRWYGDNIELISDTSWAEDCFVTERNFNYIVEMSKPEKAVFDVGATFQTDFSLQPMLLGKETAAQVAEKYSNDIQNELDLYLGKSGQK